MTPARPRCCLSGDYPKKGNVCISHIFMGVIEDERQDMREFRGFEEDNLQKMR
jgi:hypothetical protein